MSYIPAVRWTQKISTIGKEEDDRHRNINFEMCRAIDLTSLSIVLNRMVTDSSLDKSLAEIYMNQASSLLALILSENNRIHGF